jgi:lipopolysaccharide/colanic/teichoic acid biosynthesis glycosyltransferase
MGSTAGTGTSSSDDSRRKLLQWENHEMMRRLADIAVALTALALLSPLLLLVTVGLVIVSPGNPFYAGLRVGKNGRPFRMWKFRTMVNGADRLGGSVTGPRDPRVTTVGRLLRATKIDELPQFFNLLVGDLTLVGPRPEVSWIVKLYSSEQRETLKVKPGITSPGTLYYTTDQVHRIPQGMDAEDFYTQHLLGEKLRIDLEYLRRRTALSDCRVILETTRLLAKRLTFLRHSDKREVLV